MKKLITMLLCLPLLFTTCKKEEEEPTNTNNGNSNFITWEKTFGGSDIDKGYSVQQTTDGGYIITGFTSSGFGNGDVYLIKTDGNGIEQWNNIFGGTSIDGGFSVQQTSDGGYIICGETSLSTSTLPDVRLFKTDVNGIEQWSNTFGGTRDDRGWSVQQTTNGGYIITGFTYSFGNDGNNGDVYLIKTDENGDSLWTKTFGGTDFDGGFSVQQTIDGGYIITGETKSSGNGNYDVYLIKTDGNGIEQWSQTFGGTGEDRGFSVQQTTDGGFIISGRTESFGNGGYDIYLIKTDGNGIEQWNQTYGGTGEDRGYSVQQTTDGGYIITGETSSFGNSTDVYLIKTDGFGVEEWTETFGGTGEDRGFSVQQTTDGGFIILGWTESFGNGGYDIYLIKTDSQGKIIS